MPTHMPAQRPGRSKQTYATPDTLITAITKRLWIARFTHDFAASARNAKAVSYWDREVDSLSIPSIDWAAALNGRWGWLNPPFANLRPWVRKCAHARLQGAHIAMLVPASVGANWFNDYVHKHAAVLFLNGRVEFIPGQPYPKDCMIILWGREPDYDVWSWR